MSTTEQSGSGAPIHRHTERERTFELAHGDSEAIDHISAHIEQHIGPVEWVMHEIVSDLVHVDIHVVAPTAKRNFHTLVTSGMSDRPMPAPAGHDTLKYAELMICLPASWPLTQADWANEENYWPIRWLKTLARFPHEYGTWLWALHSVPNGDPAQPFAGNTPLCGVVLMPPVTVGDAFRELRINEEKTIHFHAMVPLLPDEMTLKLAKGAEALCDGFDKHGVNELLDPARKSTVPQKGSWFSRWW